MEDNPNFNLLMSGEELAAVRGWWGLTQMAFARKLGVPVKHVIRWERNERLIPVTIPLLIEAIGRQACADALSGATVSQPDEPLHAHPLSWLN